MQRNGTHVRTHIELSMWCLILLTCMIAGVPGGIARGQSAAYYSFAATSGTYTSISGAVSTAAGDDGTETLDLPFVFRYCGASVTRITISTNGAIGLGTINPGPVNAFNSSSTYPVIAALWDDLYSDAQSEIRYEGAGSSPSRTFTVQWSDMLWGATSSTPPQYRQNFQIVLHEGTNEIELKYGAMSAPGTARTPGASIGLNDRFFNQFTNVIPGGTHSASNISTVNVTAATHLTNGLIYTLTPPTGLSGVKSIKSSGGTYATFTDAFVDLNNHGVASSGVEFEVDAGLVSNENPGTLRASGTAAGPVVFRSVGSGANARIVRTQSGTACVDIGGKHITFENIDLATSVSGVNYGYYIRALSTGLGTDSAQYNTIKGCTVSLDRSNPMSTGICQSGAAGSYNKYHNVTVANAQYGIVITATPARPAVDCEIRGVDGQTTLIGGSYTDRIGNGAPYSYGIRVTYAVNPILDRVSVVGVFGTSEVCGIKLGNTTDATISNCRVNNVYYTGTDSSINVQVAGIWVHGSGPTIYNTTVDAIHHGRTTVNFTSTLVAGIWVSADTVYLYHNTVRMNCNGYARNSALWVDADIIILRNSILTNYSATPLNAQNICFQYAGAILYSNVIRASNNLYYYQGNTYPPTNYVFSGGGETFHRYVAGLYNATTGATQENGSTFHWPNFTSTTDFTFSSPTTAALSGTPIPGISTDIEGTARNASRPTIGAYETAQSLDDRIAPTLSNPQIVSGVSNPEVAISVFDNSQSTNNATIRLWYRKIGSTNPYIGIDADVKPGGAMNGVYRWTSSLATLADGQYKFYITVRDDRGPAENIWAYPTWRSYYAGNYFLGFTSSDPPQLCDTIFARTLTFEKTGSFAGGTYTVGSGENYDNLVAAAAAISVKTITGPVVFELTGNYSGNEGGQVAFASIYGTSSTNTVTVRPAAGVSRRETNFWTNNYSTISIANTSHIILDGRPGGSGTTIGWSIVNPAGGTGVNGKVLQLADGASHCTVRYVQVRGANDYTMLSGLLHFGTSVNVAGNHSNTVEYCEFTSILPSGTYGNAIFSEGSTGKPNNDNTVEACRISNCTSAGVLLKNNNSAWTIRGNHIFKHSPYVSTSAVFLRGIGVENTGSGYVISGNYIGGDTTYCGGVWSVTSMSYGNFSGMYLYGSGDTAFTVDGNTIAGISMTSAGTNTTPARIFVGIDLVRGGATIGGTTGNIIGSSSGTRNIVATSSVAGMTAYGIHCQANTVPVVINNNTIGSITVRGMTGIISHSLTGIAIDSGGAVVVHNNTIGSAGSDSSLNAETASTGSVAQSVTGIANKSTGTIAITGNTIRNLTNRYARTNSTDSRVAGIVSTAGAATITGNTVAKLSTLSPNNSSGTSASVLGIAVNATAAGPQVISENLIHSLANVCGSVEGVRVAGIAYQGPASGDNRITRNIVHSLTLIDSSTAAEIDGIRLIGGAVAVQNNFVRIGTTPEGNPLETGCMIHGICETAGTNSIHFNSVEVNGNDIPGATRNTMALYSSASSGTRTVQNNIFSNTRSGGTGGKHYAASVAGTAPNPAGLTIDYNLYNAAGLNGAIGLYNGADAIHLRAWRLAVGQDAHSRSGDPRFIAPANAAETVNLHIDATAATAVEGSGLVVAGITQDADGDTRGSAPDIGADEGSFTALGNFDSDARIVAVSAQVPAANISSLITTAAAATDVFTFAIADSGSSDGLNTTVLSLTLRNAATTHRASWSKNIAGVTLHDASPIGIGVTQITDDSITIAIPSGNLIVQDGGIRQVTLGIYFMTSGTLEDGAALQFAFAGTAHGCDAEASGSDFAADFGAAITSNSHTIDVVAAQLALELPGRVSRNLDFSATVRTVDANGNVDIHSTPSITLSKNSGGGTFSSAGGLTRSLALGVCTWTDLRYDTYGSVRVQADATGFSTVTSPDIACQYLAESFEYTWTGTPAAPAGWSVQHAASTGTGGGSDPVHWTRNSWNGSAWSAGGQGTPLPAGATEGAAVAWYADAAAKAGQKAMIVTPVLDLGAASSPRITFRYALNASSSAVLIVRASSNGGSVWNDVQTITNPGTAWSAVNLNLPAAYKSTTTLIGFEATASYGSHDLWIDEVAVDEWPQMVYQSSTTTQNTATVNAGATAQQIIGIEILTPGSSNPLSVTRFTVNASGSNNISSNITNARLYFTGASPTYSPVNQFGSTVGAPTAADFTISGSQQLLEGMNHFWLAYDIPSTAINGNAVDAQCVDIRIDGIDRVPTVSSPAGSRSIVQKTLNSVTVTQASTAGLRNGMTDQEVLRLDFSVTGPESGSLLLEDIAILSTSTNDADISAAGVKLYSTLTSSTFSTGTQLGSAQSLVSGAASFSGLHHNLPPGHSYIWLSYDIASNATHNNVVDAKIAPNAISVGGNTYNAGEENPPGTRTITYYLSGVKTVGTGGDFATLTGSNGLFEQVNMYGLQGDLSVKIISDITEDGLNALNEWAETGTGQYSLSIGPDGTTERVISGAVTNAMIRLDGADRVRIDGRYNGNGRYLRLRNTSPLRSAFALLNGATHDTVLYTTVEAAGSPTGVIAFLTSTASTGNSNNVISHNIVRDCNCYVNMPYYMIYSSGTATKENSANIISDNQLLNFGLSAVRVDSIGNGDAWTIEGNSIYTTIAQSSAGLACISMGCGSGHSIRNNRIGGSNVDGSGAAFTHRNSFRGISLKVGAASPTEVQGNIISNLNITGSTGQTFYGMEVLAGVVNIGTTAGNTIGGGVNPYDTIAVSYHSYGIATASPGAVAIHNNLVSDITQYSSSAIAPFSTALRGIYSTNPGAVDIRYNTIRNLASTAVRSGLVNYGLCGISVSASTSPAHVEANTIHNLVNINTDTMVTRVGGIYLSTSLAATVVTGNRIRGLSVNATGTDASRPQIVGIYSNGSSGTCSNNQISIGTESGHETLVQGMVYQSSTGGSTWYNNSVVISGISGSGTAGSHAFLRTYGGAVQLRNNILSNERTGGSGGHYAIGNTHTTPATGWSATASNHNLLVSTDASRMGEWGSGTARDFAQWKTSSGGDAASLAHATATLVPADLFVDIATGDLHLDSTATACWFANGNGTALSAVPTDFDGDARSTSTAGSTDIGADETAPTCIPPVADMNGTPMNSGTSTFSLGGRTLAVINWNANGQVPNTVALRFYSGTNPPNADAGSRHANCYWDVDVDQQPSDPYSMRLYFHDNETGTIQNPGSSNIEMAKGSGTPFIWTIYRNGTGNNCTVVDYSVTPHTATVSGISTGFSLFSLSEAGAPLPVELASFSAVAINNTIHLRWSTTTEANNAGFDVLRSTENIDGNWTAIAFVPGQGTSTTTKRYTYTDDLAGILPPHGRVWYRLLQRDRDGRSSLSPILGVELSTPAALRLAQNFPNPFRDATTLQFSLPAARYIFLTVHDALGREVAALADGWLESGNHAVRFDAGDLPAGQYRCTLEAGGEVLHRMITIVR